MPVLGLIFLRYADHQFEQAEKELSGHSSSRRTIGKADYQARGVLFLRTEARFANLLKLPEGANIGAAINAAMKAIEDENEDLCGVLPQVAQPAADSRRRACGDSGSAGELAADILRRRLSRKMRRCLSTRVRLVLCPR